MTYLTHCIINVINFEVFSFTDEQNAIKELTKAKNMVLQSIKYHQNLITGCPALYTDFANFCKKQINEELSKEYIIISCEAYQNLLDLYNFGGESIEIDFAKGVTVHGVTLDAGELSKHFYIMNNYNEDCKICVVSNFKNEDDAMLAIQSDYCGYCTIFDIPND